VRNAGFWASKRNRNRERDAETDRVLLESGWRVLRYWEHEVRADPEAVVDAIAGAVCG
jgi:DNA mismatch endonuclease (patch repair protein)